MRDARMIVLVECKTIMAERDELYYETMHHRDGVARIATVQDPYESVEVTQEHIQGRIFVNSRGERICLGLSNQVSKALSFPFELIEQQAEEIKSLESKSSKLSNDLQSATKELLAFHSADIWHRIVFLFRGKL